MITAIEIENFKAFGSRQRIELKPITLLFGPNGAGKSIVSDAMMFVLKVVSGDMGRDPVAGELFRDAVHGHDFSKPIVVAFEFDFGAVFYGDFPQNPEEWNLGDGTHDEFLGLIGDGDTARVEIRVELVGNRPVVTQSQVWIDGHRIGTVEAPSKNESAVVYLNFGHPILDVTGEFDREPDWQPDDETWESDFWKRRELLFGESLYEKPNGISINLSSGLPNDFVEVTEKEVPRTSWSDLPNNAVDNFNAVIRYLLAQPVLRLRFELEGSRFLDSLRGQTRSERDGAGFDRVKACSILIKEEKTRQLVALRLSRNDGLCFPMTPEVREEWQVTGQRRTTDRTPDWSVFDPTTVAKLTSRRIVLVDERSQTEIDPDRLSLGSRTLLPIVVACLDTTNNADGKFDPETARPVGMIVIEEPEAHLHPTASAALGDLFVDTGLRKGGIRKNLLVETHSEHLTLRILRRFREESIKPKPDFSATDLAIYYFSGREYFGKPFRLEVDDAGNLLQPWPDDFFNQDDLERFA